MKPWKILLSNILFFFVAGMFCSVVYGQDIADRMKLDTCIADYKDGNYQKAADSLQKILPALSSPEDLMEAYKYLGYSFGMLNWIDKAKDVFKTVLKKFPSMTIDSLEAPPNIAIIFRQAKLERKLENLDTAAMAKPRIIVQKKKILVPVLLLSASIICAGAGADLVYLGNQDRQKYLSVATPDQSVLDRYYSSARNSYIGAAVCATAASVFLPVSIYLFMKKDTQKNSLTVSCVRGSPALLLTF